MLNLLAGVVIVMIAVLSSKGTASRRASAAAEKKNAEVIEKHRRVHPTIDLRATVFLVVLGAMNALAVNEGRVRIPDVFLIINVWISFVGAAASLIAMAVSWHLFSDSQSSEEEKRHVRGISLRKTIAYTVALVAISTIFLNWAIGVTVGLS